MHDLLIENQTSKPLHDQLGQPESLWNTAWKQRWLTCQSSIWMALSSWTSLVSRW